MCSTLYTPKQCVSVDERMVKCKGRAPFRQYIPKKPVKWGFKLFAMCDASSGVLCHFEVYTGQAIAGEEGLTHAVVTRLTVNLHNQEYIVTTDNFYTSNALATSLLE